MAEGVVWFRSMMQPMVDLYYRRMFTRRENRLDTHTDLIQSKDTSIYEIIKRGRFADFYEFVGITGEERIEKIPEFMETYGNGIKLSGGLFPK